MTFRRSRSGSLWVPGHYAPGRLSTLSRVPWDQPAIARDQFIYRRPANRLSASHVVYLGSFRLPTGLAGSSSGFQFAGFGSGGKGGCLAYYSNGNSGAGSLFISGQDHLGASVAEIAIPGTGTEPALVPGDQLNGVTPTADNPLGIGGSTNVTSLPTARYLQNFADVSNGLVDADSVPPIVSNLHVYNGHLYIAVKTFFSDSGRVSFIRHGLDLSVSDAFGYETVRDANLWNGWADVSANPAMAVTSIAGPMADVPSALQSSLGGPVISGVWGVSIISRASFGPAAFSWDPDQIGSDTPSSTMASASSSPVNATGLLYYPQEHKTLGDWGWMFTGQPYYGWNDFPGAIVIESNCVLFLMITGAEQAVNPNTGLVESTHYYGDSTWDWSQNGVFQSGAGDPGTPGAWYYHFDRQNSGPGHGPGSWPYYYRVVAFTVEDFQAVKAGTKKPWEITPYGKWNFSIPFTMGFPGSYPPATPSGTYDRAHKILYVMQNGSVDQPTAYFPLVHVYRLT